MEQKYEDIRKNVNGQQERNIDIKQKSNKIVMVIHILWMYRFDHEQRTSRSISVSVSVSVSCDCVSLISVNSKIMGSKTVIGTKQATQKRN